MEGRYYPLGYQHTVTEGTTIVTVACMDVSQPSGGRRDHPIPCEAMISELLQAQRTICLLGIEEVAIFHNGFAVCLGLTMSWLMLAPFTYCYTV